MPPPCYTCTDGWITPKHNAFGPSYTVLIHNDNTMLMNQHTILKYVNFIILLLYAQTINSYHASKRRVLAESSCSINAERAVSLDL